MTIHHDKLAYGKLASLTEDFSEERLIEMAKKLSENSETEPAEEGSEKSDREKKRKN